MGEIDVLVRYREFLKRGRLDSTTPQDKVSYGKERPLKWHESNRLLNEINRIEKQHGLPLTEKQSLSIN